VLIALEDLPQRRYTPLMASLSIQGVAKSFGSSRVLDNVSLEISSGEFFSLLGPSGCGKSTLLRIIAGLENADRGTVAIDGKRIDRVAPQHRGIGMVFQQYALWPHMTIGQNVRFGLESLPLSKSERETRVMRSLERVQMETLVERFPHEISGGQQQRVALARALAMQPSIILLDEPLSNLDARLRSQIRQELVDLHSALGTTMVYVTHDQEDALALSSRIAIIHQGLIQQVGTPREIYSHPRSEFVAKFIGDANLIPGTVESQTADQVIVRLKAPMAPLVSIPIPQGQIYTKDANGFLCLRPSNLSISAKTGGSTGTVDIQAQIRRIIYRGASYMVELAVLGLPTLHAELREHQLPNNSREGDTVHLSWDTQAAVFVG
jgi:ABC-type Fe3+/spermidine/putrescine transport system ATPase subunit